MKKLIMTIMFLGLLILPLSASAGPCERYWDELVEQCFATTIDETEFTVCFSDSVFGPCPGGRVVLSYIDTQIINDIEYEALVEIDFEYLTDFNFVTVAGLDFLLIEDYLILIPEDPLMFQKE